MITRLARWWLARKPKPVGRTGECVCGREVSGNDLHTVVAHPTDGLDEGDGGTFMAADFCPACCPGGCRQGCSSLSP